MRLPKDVTICVGSLPITNWVKVMCVFFFDKLLFYKRYAALHQECLARGFNVQNRWADNLPQNPDLWRDYQPTETALAANRARIAERMPAKARFTPHRVK